MRKLTPTRALGPKKKTNASSTTSASMAKVAGAPFPNKPVILQIPILFHINSKTHNSFPMFVFVQLAERQFSCGTGLLRCGKSCRLRWINYLRPDLKRGNFTEEEDELIIKLHSLLGNK